jgi:hypothetical protein
MNDRGIEFSRLDTGVANARFDGGRRAEDRNADPGELTPSQRALNGATLGLPGGNLGSLEKIGDKHEKLVTSALEIVKKS